MKLLKPISQDATNAFQTKYDASSHRKQRALQFFHPRKFNAMFENMLAEKQLCSDVIMQVGQGIVVLDRNWKISSANPELESIFGMKAEDAGGMTIIDFFSHFADGEQMEILVSQLNSRSRGEKGEYELSLSVAGERRDIKITATPRTDKAGRIIGSIGVIEDITDRKREQEQLEMFFRGVDSSPSAVAITDLSGYTIYANGSYELLSCAPLDRLRGKVPPTLVHSPIKQLWPGERFAGTAGGKTGWKGQLTPTSGNCKGKVLETSVSPIVGRDGKVFGLLVIHEDVSGLVKMGEELSAKNLALNEAVDRLSQLMSILFHDIKNPVGTIEGFCVGIKEDYGKSLDPEAHKYLDIVIGAAKQIGNIIADLSEWVSGSKMAIEPFMLGDMVSNAVELNRINAEKKGIEISGENLDGMVFADKKMAFFVLRNLIANSVKFTGEGGFIHVSVEDKGGYAQVAVTDNGVGIAPERMARIFEGGMHSSTIGTKGEKGTGFGIRQCKEFVEQMGGKIWVESNTKEEAHGSTFFFTLPKNQPANGSAKSGE